MLVTKFDRFINAERKKNRKDSQNRSEKMKNCEDIIDSLSDIDEHHDEVKLLCVAARWAKIPKISPESVPDICTAEKVAQLEGKLKIFESSLSEMKARQLLLEQKTSPETPEYRKPLLSEVVARGRVPGMTASSTGEKQQHNFDSKSKVSDLPGGATAGEGNAHSATASCPTFGPSKEQPKVLNSASTDSSSARGKRKELHVQEGFQYPADQRKKQRRSEQNVKRVHHVAGKASNTRGLKSTPSPCRDFFIYRVHKDNNETEIKEYLAGNNIELVSIEKRSHTDSKFHSFHVAVRKQDAQQIMDPEIWPSGICIRRWSNRKAVDNKENEETEMREQR